MSEKVDIWMPFYPGDYLASTMHLTCEESGAYLHLLFHSWKVGPLPTDMEQLRRIARVEKKPWAGVWASIRGFWTEGEAGYTQKRLEEERTAWGQKKVLAVAKAKAAVAAREAKRDAERNSGSSPRSTQDDHKIIPSSSSLPDSSYEESSKARESGSAPPISLNRAATEIACAHPWAIARHLQAGELEVGDVVAIVTAIKREASDLSVSPEMAATALLQFTRSYAAAVALWPPGDQRFVLGIAKFFTTFEYRKDPQSWRRDGTDGQSGKKPGGRARTAAEERHRDGLGKVLGAFADVLGEEGLADSDGPDHGELRNTGDPGRMARGNAVTLDAFGSDLWNTRPA